MNGFVAKPIDDMESIHGGVVKLAGAELGVESFGLQVLDLPAGFDYPEHDHVQDGQEEVYFVLRGSADIVVDGDTKAVSEGQMMRVAPASRRCLVPGADGVRVLAIGCSPAAPYERPEDFRLAAQR